MGSVEVPVLMYAGKVLEHMVTRQRYWSIWCMGEVLECIGMGDVLEWKDTGGVLKCLDTGEVLKCMHTGEVLEHLDTERVLESMDIGEVLECMALAPAHQLISSSLCELVVGRGTHGPA
ncbi:hypothetical protein NDU88_012705 [Pleurodeles waltl]|uniref:Uncharacterized protein n=1 Tax=Pleurodeles waltl TaxID=8319 RepID=A0AAV7R0U4_PLEWA|nr:hypothetical protein NDU88_012701 [Pleurodeles waltl]KAJ1146429.1 hypothetical protein NDU88_012705 [Pleurodeles waltl]